MDKNILALFDEILQKIFEYVEDREKVKLTCQRFYKIVCDIEKNKYRMKLNNENVS